MASFMTAADIVAAAVEIERRGYAFYDELKKEADHQDDRDFFAFMAQEEKRHESIFEAMLQRLGGVSLPADSDDAEYLAYVQGLLDSHTLFMPEQKERAKISPLGEAMRFEKDTMIFFLELEHVVPEAEKQAVRLCAKEERKHLQLLLKHRQKIEKA